MIQFCLGKPMLYNPQRKIHMINILLLTFVMKQFTPLGLLGDVSYPELGLINLLAQFVLKCVCRKVILKYIDRKMLTNGVRI